MKKAGLARAVDLLDAGDWQAAHAIVQRDEESKLTCWAHGIVHVMEGDLSNAQYWYRAAARAFPEPYSVKGEIGALREAIRSLE